MQALRLLSFPYNPTDAIMKTILATTLALTSFLLASCAPMQQGTGYSQPGYGQPGYGQPGYGQPGYSQSGQGGYTTGGSYYPSGK